MSLTVATHTGSTTPIPSSLKRNFFSSAQNVDTTPVALASTTPALREAFILFAESLEPIRDRATVRLVLGSDLTRPTLVWNAAISGRPVLVLRVGEAAPIDLEAADALTVFETIRCELGVPQKELLAATGIKHRTFYSWKRSTLRPRSSSLGRLWNLADALVDLRETLERPVGAWLHSSNERMALFKAGRFEDLVDLAVAMPKPPEKAQGTSHRIGIATDVGVPLVKTNKPKVSVVRRGARR